ncbi:U3 small nucleolar RNA-associated protein 20-like [Pyrus ussuriensis x Pyrus communis]|uniref:U3 small nucleolar RNA-associated protein 20-like n=1 Tax=Pyrus ussuriensis x Pyrus communis TaxID=2448454 RepID=A0A5N5HNT2_9ROSA|nr:U3 small nucleolar RNA-associated protein 20-like [Pyrus ussuriensis x Pyrus communis]
MENGVMANGNAARQQRPETKPCCSKRASVLAQARVFPTPPPSLCLPLLTVLLMNFHGLLASGSQNSSSGCLNSSVEDAYQMVLGFGCYGRCEVGGVELSES